MHEEEHLRLPSIEEFDLYQKESDKVIRYLTIAPENDKDHRLIKYASSQGVTVSIGHTGASMAQALLATANGATSFTHSFNAMKALNHREPGVVGALMSSNVFAEIIADGHHVHPNAIKILARAKNSSNLILVSDAIGVKGLPAGTYEISGIKVDLDEYGTARRHGTDVIAGSSLRINEGVGLLVEKALLSIEDAILSASLYPAMALRIDNRKGRLVYGADADITVLNKDWSVDSTYCMGIKEEI
jgi:N-acetylglucosamine-6-phosphate deacetylase